MGVRSFYIVVSVLFAALLGAEGSCAVEDSFKQDCGSVGTDESTCVASGCCWQPLSDGSSTPWCFKAVEGVDSSTYNLKDMRATKVGYEGTLEQAESGYAAYGSDIKSLKMELIFENEAYVRLRVTDASQARWEVPSSVVARPSVTEAVPAASRQYNVDIQETPFSVKVTRKSDGTVVLQTGDQLVFKDQYLQMTSVINSSARTYGLGESARTSHALEAGQTYTMWAVDNPAANMNKNLYGSFPFYLQHVNDAVHGVLLFNSNGMDILVDEAAITYKVLGGVLDVYAFVGPTGDEVVSQYTDVVGRPMMPPYWSLGFHNCKYGYTDVWQVESVVQQYEEAGIPLDTQWMDIDYMEEYRDFTSDPSKFPISEVSSFVDELHANGQHFVQIIDPGIEPHDDYDSYTRGKEMDIFIKDITGQDFLGQVWPGPAVFPDFFHPKIDEYWRKEISDYLEKVPLDGLWIDMNEVANFCNVAGTEQTCTNTAPSGCPAPGASQTDCCLECRTVDASNTWDFPPYSIGNALGHLNAHTMSMSSVQRGLSENTTLRVYDTHNLYGITEAIATNKALTDVRKERPFMITRSSFPGSGKFTGKWQGDNAATWDDLKSSVVSMMDFNFFGIPMTGADICGFIGDTTEELCARWIALGAFYPFSRDHNALGYAPQELYVWPTVTTAAQRALAMRYRMLPYLYTLFYAAHREGLTVARPLWFNYPADEQSAGIVWQFMLGSSVLVSPVLEQGATSVSAYFPAGLWYDFEAMTLAVDAMEGGKWLTLDTPLEKSNVHIRGGSVLALHGADKPMTTQAARTAPFTLLVALCGMGMAQGEMFWDNGKQVELDETLSLSFYAEVKGEGTKEGRFTSTVDHSSYPTDSTIGAVTILGKALTAPRKVFVNGDLVATSDYTFDATRGELTIGVSQPLASALEVTWV